MKATLTALAVVLGCAFAGTAGAALSKDEYKTQKDRVQADYKAAKDKCGPLKDNARDICKAEAKGSYEVAKAELEQQYHPSAKHEAKVKTEKATADYKVAKQKCQDLKGDPKDACKKDAKVTYDTARGQAKARSATPANG